MPKLRNQVQATAATAVPAAIAASQSPGGAGLVTINGSAVTAGVATITPQPVVITSAGNDSGITFTVTGTDANGTPISEVVTGSNGATASSINQFATITSVRVSGATAAAITIGTGAIQYSPWLIIGAQRNNFTYQVRSFLPAGTAAANYDIQTTSDQNLMINNGQFADDIDTVAAALTGNASSFPNAPWEGIRLKVNTGGPVILRVLESRTA